MGGREPSWSRYVRCHALEKMGAIAQTIACKLRRSRQTQAVTNNRARVSRHLPPSASRRLARVRRPCRARLQRGARAGRLGRSAPLQIERGR